MISMNDLKTLCACTPLGPTVQLQIFKGAEYELSLADLLKYEALRVCFESQASLCEDDTYCGASFLVKFRSEFFFANSQNSNLIQSRTSR